MPRRSRRARSGSSRWARRGRRLAMFGGLVASVAGLRNVVLRRDQRAFEARYGPGPDREADPRSEPDPDAPPDPR